MSIFVSPKPLSYSDETSRQEAEDIYVSQERAITVARTSSWTHPVSEAQLTKWDEEAREDFRLAFPVIVPSRTEVECKTVASLRQLGLDLPTYVIASRLRQFAKEWAEARP